MSLEHRPLRVQVSPKDTQGGLADLPGSCFLAPFSCLLLLRNPFCLCPTARRCARLLAPTNLPALGIRPVCV